jgi:hypothetical protein
MMLMEPARAEQPSSLTGEGVTDDLVLPLVKAALRSSGGHHARGEQAEETPPEWAEGRGGRQRAGFSAATLKPALCSVGPLYLLE